MNDYLAILLAEDHRDTLLAEARANGLAREAAAGRPSWWQRLSARSAAWAAEHRGTRSRQTEHRLAA